MHLHKFTLPLIVALCLVAPSIGWATLARAQAPVASPDAQKTKSQSELANSKVTFGKIAESDTKVKSALVAHDLTAAKALIGKSGSLIGTVATVFPPKGNKLVILNLDHDYKTAVSVVVESENFSKFPDLKSLVGKKIVVSGKFEPFRGAAELIVSQPADVKIVE